mmetsp:Transcript_27324/g.71607  ORF Transcript_27324/g.71607 Transcript_27324/m.71607 type:complete len:242 (+) Transcript_27324:412-1137(+)
MPWEWQCRQCRHRPLGRACRCRPRVRVCFTTIGVPSPESAAAVVVVAREANNDPADGLPMSWQSAPGWKRRWPQRSGTFDFWELAPRTLTWYSSKCLSQGNKLLRSRLLVAAPRTGLMPGDTARRNRARTRTVLLTLARLMVHTCSPKVERWSSPPRRSPSRRVLARPLSRRSTLSMPDDVGDRGGTPHLWRGPGTFLCAVDQHSLFTSGAVVQNRPKPLCSMGRTLLNRDGLATPPSAPI